MHEYTTRKEFGADTPDDLLNRFLWLLSNLTGIYRVGHQVYASTHFAFCISKDLELDRPLEVFSIVIVDRFSDQIRLQPIRTQFSSPSTLSVSTERNLMTQKRVLRVSLKSLRKMTYMAYLIDPDGSGFQLPLDTVYTVPVERVDTSP